MQRACHVLQLYAGDTSVTIGDYLRMRYALCLQCACQVLQLRPRATHALGCCMPCVRVTECTRTHMGRARVPAPKGEDRGAHRPDARAVPRINCPWRFRAYSIEPKHRAASSSTTYTQHRASSPTAHRRTPGEQGRRKRACLHRAEQICPSHSSLSCALRHGSSNLNPESKP